jgi:nucleotide-binding universal stress UspA family protein
VRWAAVEAERRNVRLHVVHVVEQGGRQGAGLPTDIPHELELARQRVPGRVGGWVFRAGIDVDISVSIVTGDVGEQLAREAGDAALVVIGAPGSLHHSALPLDLANTCLGRVAMVGPFGDVTYVDVANRAGARGRNLARR